MTTLEDQPQTLYDEACCQRGDMENRIRKQQLMRFADRTSCHQFAANQFRLLLSSFAYVLLFERRATHLAETDLATAQIWRPLRSQRSA